MDKLRHAHTIMRRCCNAPHPRDGGLAALSAKRIQPSAHPLCDLHFCPANHSQEMMLSRFFYCSADSGDVHIGIP